MQPIYLTLSSSGSSPWKLTNWHCDGPMNIGVSVACNSTSTFEIDYTVDDISGTYPNPTLGASNTTPVAAIRLTMTKLSSAGGLVTATILQAGIG